MPLRRWQVQPEAICLNPVPDVIKSDHLECVANSCLATVIQQLGSLSQHAEQLFQCLVADTQGLSNRANVLQLKYKELEVKMQQLDVKTDGASELPSLFSTTPFNRKVVVDTQIFKATTRPGVIQEKLNRCEGPPALEKLNPFREDGKDSVKLYTNPDYFLDLWCQEMLR
ncbi:hypothetical protein CAPTEDRAFT_77454, partial [Capitella teleta]